MSQITIKGRYGKRKIVEVISFDSNRVYTEVKSFGHRSKVEYYIYIDGEDRKITFENESEMLSFKRQMELKPSEVKKEEFLNLTGIDKVKAQFIDVREWAMYKDPDNCTIFNHTTYMFDLPRIGERFNSNGMQWQVSEFLRVDNDNVKIYVNLVSGAI